MKRICFTLFGFFLLAQSGELKAQWIYCNDFVSLSLDENCQAILAAEQLLIGTCACPMGTIVEIDTVPPLGNGPWAPAILGTEHLSTNYPYRVIDISNGNTCWGWLRVEDKVGPVMDCSSLTTVSLGSGGSAVVPVSALQVTATDACSDANQVIISELNNNDTVSYSCSQLGLNVVSMKATDEFGNSSTCFASVLVTDSENACASGCVTFCPVSQIVTYEEGINDLLPAFTAGDNSVFDGFGTAVFDPGCTPSDTFYMVTLTPGIAGFSSFERSWDIQLGGISFGTCSQVIAFPHTQTHVFTGRIFIDSILNCLFDPGENGLDEFEVQFKKLPGNEIANVIPGADGVYVLELETTIADTAIEVRLLLPGGLSTACPTVRIISLDTASVTQTTDFSLYSREDCGLPFVNIGTPFFRRCFSNNFYTVTYGNHGFDTIPDASLTIVFDTLLTVINAGWPFTNIGNTYTFLLGNLPPFYSNSFAVQVLVECDAELGQTLCTEAHLYPQLDCTDPWEEAVVDVSSNCDGDSVVFVIKNIGQADMTQMLTYIVVEDIIMRGTGTFQLPAGDSMLVKQPANGSTWRLETEQIPGYTAYVLPSATIEGCGGINTPGLVNAFAQSDDPLYHDIDCIVVTGSFDPNDKTAVPTGYGAENTIRANTELDYKIRFQNTGNDTAFTVIIIDTLPAQLIPATFEAGAYSHTYRLDVLEYGILRFVFENIMLPDSNVNEPASHGFITFRIKQQPDLPNGTVINNSAAIYFDFNEPIITNTAFHTIGAPYVEVSTNTPFVSGVTVLVRPNPFEDRSVLELQGYNMQNGLLRLYDVQGCVLQSIGFTGNQCILERGGLPAGTYFFHIADDGIPVSSGKIMVK